MIASRAERYDPKARSSLGLGAKLHDRELFILRKQTGWREELIAGSRRTWLMRFWKDWLVVGDGDLERDLTAPIRSYKWVNQRVHLIYLPKLSIRTSIDGNTFVPAGR